MVRSGDRLGRYLLGAELGEGGMATVYAARDTELRRDVAVKVLFGHLARRKELVSRFQREARAAAALDHRHILRVFDVGGGDPDEAGDEPIDPPYIVLELVRGQSLSDFAERHGPPPAEVVAATGAVVCDALAVAHRAGIIHRDIKPANLMVTDKGRVALADFGVARVEDEDSVVTRTGTLLGTPAFMSPEQATGDPLDARSDLYSLGASLYALATGSLPYSGNAAKIVSKILSGDLVPPLRRRPTIGPDLSRTIVKLMAVDPADRYPDAAAAGEALREVAGAGGFDDLDKLLADFYADPTDSRDRLEKTAAQASLELARSAAASGQLPRAMALADRVLALEPGRTDAVDLVESLGRKRTRVRALAVAGAIVAIGAAAALVVGWVGRGGGAPAPAADAGAVTDAAVELDAARLAVIPAVAIDAAGALPVDAGSGGRTPTGDRPSVVRRRIDAAPAVAVPDDPPARPDAAVARPPALVAVSVDVAPWCEITIDGVGHGPTPPVKEIRLPAGPHHVVCENRSTGQRWEKKIQLVEGRPQQLKGKLPPAKKVTVTVKLSHGDSVRIGGVPGSFKNGDKVAVEGPTISVSVYQGGSLLKSQHSVPVWDNCTLKDNTSQQNLVCR